MSIKKVVESLVAAEDMRAMWNEFSKKLINAGFEENALLSYKRSENGRILQNKNIIYMHPDKDIVFIFIYKASSDIIYPVVMNKEDYIALDKSLIFLTSSRNDKVLLPAINALGITLRLHRFICKSGADYYVDHIAMSGSICTRDMLRPATDFQNKTNTLKYTKLYEDYFEGIYKVSDDKKVKMEKAGYTFMFREKKGDANMYRVRSPKFEEEDAMYAALQKCERTFLKEFRYDLIKACTTEKEVFLHFCKEAFGWAEKDYVEAKKYLLTKTMEDAEGLFKYYGV